MSICGVDVDEDWDKDPVTAPAACDGSRELLSDECGRQRTNDVTPVASSDNVNEPRNSCLGKCLQVILTLVLRDQSIGRLAAVVEIVVTVDAVFATSDSAFFSAAGDGVWIGLNMAVMGFCFDVSSETDLRFLLSLLPVCVLLSAVDEHGDCWLMPLTGVSPADGEEGEKMPPKFSCRLMGCFMAAVVDGESTASFSWFSPRDEWTMFA